MKKENIMSHNPCAGIIRIRFGGYNLSPKAPLCSSDAKIVQGERKRKELVHFLFPNRSLSLLFSLSLHHFRDLSVPKDPSVPKKDPNVPKRS